MTSVLALGEPAPDHECPSCGFDSCCAFPVHRLTTEGVTHLGEVHVCGRCRATQTMDA